MGAPQLDNIENLTDKISTEFSCCIIGEGNLAIACLELLKSKSHHIKAVVANAPDLYQHATAQNIPCQHLSEDIYDWLATQDFDFLFSIYNLHICSEALLSLPKKGAINIHDAPLPKYAGLNAPAWAILNKETTHGITWHWMNNEIDQGDILKQVCFPISPKETTLSLNVKCIEFAKQAFSTLIDEIATNNVSPSKQDLTQASYFGRIHRPNKAAVILWDDTAENLDTMIRGLDYGPYQNMIAVPRLLIGREPYILKKAEVNSENHKENPGNIINISDSHIDIACSDGYLRITEIKSLKGKSIKINELVQRHNLKNGQRLVSPSNEDIKALDQYINHYAHQEKYWIQKLSKPTNPIIHTDPTLQENKPKLEQHFTWSPSSSQVNRISHTFRNENVPETLLGIYILFLGRYYEKDRFSVGLVQNIPSENPFVLSFIHPLTSLSIAFKKDDPPRYLIPKIINEYRETITRSPYLADLIERTPLLTNDDVDSNETSISLSIDKQNEELLNKPNSLHLHIDSSDGSMIFRASHNVFYENELNDFIKRFSVFLDNLLNEPDKTYTTTSLLRHEEHLKIINQWSLGEYTPLLQTNIIDWFESIVDVNAENTAIVYNKKHISYQTLELWSNSIANTLLELGSEPQSIAVILERSDALIATMLAILKLGSTCIPIDPKQSPHQISNMLSIANVKTVVSSLKHANNPAIQGKHFLDIEGISNKDTSRLNVRTRSETAFIYFTSGTTGTPKAIKISHKRLCNYIQSANQYYDLSHEDSLLQFATPGFDAALEEIFCALCSGAKLIIRDGNSTFNNDAFIDSITTNNVSILPLPTAYWHHLCAYLSESNRRLPDCVRLVIIGGEQASANTLRQWQKLVPHNVKLVNSYGPTETTIAASFCDLSSTSLKSIPIGKPIPNTCTYVLDKHLNPVPISHPGEIYIGGIGIAPNYIKEKSSDKESFIKNPFSNKKEDYLFKTGDIGKWNAAGEIVFLGRQDRQIKLRGHRIELAAIEKHLLTHPSISEAVVSLGNNHQLTAFCVATNTASSLDENRIKAYLRARLPKEHVPAQILFIDNIPLNINGKVDTDKLNQFNNTTERNTETLSTLQSLLLKLWQETLQRSDFSIDDNFFALGGHSLSAASLTHNIEQVCNITLPITTFFQSQTIRELSLFIESETEPSNQSLVSLKSTGNKTPLFVIHGIGGDVYTFIDMIKYIDEDRPVFGLQIDQENADAKTIETISQRYAKQIADHYPDGPYHLLGYSIGGWFAYSVASTLLDNGKPIGMLGVIDTGPTARIHRRLRIPLLMHKLLRRLPVHIARTIKGSKGPRLDYIKAVVQSAQENLQMLEKAHNSDKVLHKEHFIALHKQYRPKRLPLNIYLFALPQRLSIKRFMWRFYALKNLITIPLTHARHGSLMTSENVEKTTEAINTALMHAEAESKDKKA